MNKQFMVDLFAAADTRDIPSFLRYLTDDVVFRFGNAPTLHGHAQVTEALTTLFQTVKKLRHTIVGVHSCSGVWRLAAHPGLVIISYSAPSTRCASGWIR